MTIAEQIMGYKKFKVLMIWTRIYSNLMLQLKAFNHQHNAVVRGATVKLVLTNAWTHLTGNHIYPKKIRPYIPSIAFLTRVQKTRKKMVKSDLLPDVLNLKEKLFWKVYEIHIKDLRFDLILKNSSEFIKN